MKRLVTILLLMLAASLAAWAQQGNTVTIQFSGAPTGTCSNIMVAINTSNGDYYNCLSGAWNKIATGGGAVISGTIAANQVAKGTAASVIGASSITDDGTVVFTTENLGIGVTPGTNVLYGQKNQNATSTFKFENTNTTNTNSISQVLVCGGGICGEFSGIATSGMYFGTTTNNFLVIRTNGLNAAQIDTAQNWAINNKIVSYNGLATTGQGVASVQAAPTVVTIGSGSSISSTSLCSTTLCPAGDYDVAVYIDITTACSTTGTYIPWLGYTDDQGAKTGSSTTTYFSAAGGLGVTPATASAGATLGLASTANFLTGHYYLHTTGAATGGLGSINYGTTAGACGTGGPMVGKMYLTVTRLR